MKYIFTIHIFLASFFGLAQSATRVNPTNATPVSMPSTANIMFVDGSDPNHMIKTTASSGFMKKSEAMDSIQAINARMASGMSAVQSAIPTNNNQLSNGAAYITSSALTWGNVTGKPTIPTNTNQLTNGSGFITSINSSMVTTALGYTPLQVEVDGSTTNEIELPSQTGQNGRFLTTNGSTPSWGTPTASTYDSLQVYNASGRLNRRMKVWEDIITPSTSQGHTVDISSAGFSTITNVQLQPARDVTSATAVPVVSLKSYTNSSLALNIVVSNNNTIANLLAPIIGLVFPASVSGITVHVRVTGY